MDSMVMETFIKNNFKMEKNCQNVFYQGFLIYKSLNQFDFKGNVELQYSLFCFRI